MQLLLLELDSSVLDVQVKVPSHEELEISPKPAFRNVVGGPLRRETIATVNLPCHDFHYPENKDFISREDVLRKLQEQLLPTADSEPTGGRPYAFAIWGPPGQGKTQLALEFARDNQSSFQSILVVFADTENKILEKFAACALFSWCYKKIDGPYRGRQRADGMVQDCRWVHAPFISLIAAGGRSVPNIHCNRRPMAVDFRQCN